MVEGWSWEGHGCSAGEMGGRGEGKVMGGVSEG